MKYLKHFNNHSLYEAYIVGSEFPTTVNKFVVSFCKLQHDIHYDKYITPHYNLFDVLYANTNGNKLVTSDILDPSEGYIPIGLCIAETGFFGTNELARFMSLKYMSCDTPDVGTLSQYGIRWGNYNNDISTIDNIQLTYINGSDGGILNTDHSSNSTIPSIFDENNNWNLSELGEINQYAVTDIDGKNKTEKIIATVTSQPTWLTDTSITNNSDAGYAPAACCCARYHTIGTEAGDWYLGAAGEISIINTLRNSINTKLNLIASSYALYCINTLYDWPFWTSTEFNSVKSYNIHLGNGGLFYNDKNLDALSILALLQY